VKVHVITWAQAETRVHKPFFAALKQCVKHRKGTLHVVAGRYKNPTSLRKSAEVQATEWWAKDLEPYLVKDRFTLCRNLKLYADVPTQPTATRPLTGYEVFLKQTSGIFGHPKRALEVVPTSTRQPRVMWTTGACTVPAYTHSKAGKKGRAHHVLGAVIVEVDDDGVFFVRHVSADSKGTFTDLGTTYTSEGHHKADQALGISLGDYHAGKEAPDVLAATRDLVRALRPRYGFLHDLLDFSSRNHHEQGLHRLAERAPETVKSEVAAAVDALHLVASWRPGVEWVVVESNHDQAFDRWADDQKVPSKDPLNAKYWCQVNAERLECEGASKGAFEREARRLGCPGNVRFLREGQSLRLHRVEHAFHGHRGPNGARGTNLAYTKMGCKITKGHTHVPNISDGVYTSGVTAKLDHGYNELPSSWMHAHTLQYADGKRCIVFVIKGRWRGGMEKAA
jgi:hypothetical protein